MNQAILLFLSRAKSISDLFPRPPVDFGRRSRPELLRSVRQAAWTRGLGAIALGSTIILREDVDGNSYLDGQDPYCDQQKKTMTTTRERWPPGRTSLSRRLIAFNLGRDYPCQISDCNITSTFCEYKNNAHWLRRMNTTSCGLNSENDRVKWLYFSLKKDRLPIAPSPFTFFKLKYWLSAYFSQSLCLNLYIHVCIKNLSWHYLISCSRSESKRLNDWHKQQHFELLRTWHHSKLFLKKEVMFSK